MADMYLYSYIAWIVHGRHGEENLSADHADRRIENFAERAAGVGHGCAIDIVTKRFDHGSYFRYRLAFEQVNFSAHAFVDAAKSGD